VVDAAHRDSAMLIGMMPFLHPKLREWVEAGKLVNVEVVEKFDDQSCYLVLDFDAQKIQVHLPRPPKSGSKGSKDRRLIEMIRSVLDEETLAKIALYLT